MAEPTAAPVAGESLFAWSGADRGLVAATAGQHCLAVADSWLVDDGRVRGLRLHVGRFTDACRSRHGLAASELADFLDAVVAALPRTGRWFPRVEFHPGTGLRLRLRVAPSPSTEVVLRPADGPDPRTAPTVKGPDIELLTGLRRSAACHGAGEALLVTANGTVLEGAFSGLLWWRDEVLCAPARHLPVLPSITRRLLLDIAAERGTDVRFETCRVHDLDGLELWTVSALHGIRPVTSWSGPDMSVVHSRRAPIWQAALLEKSFPLDQVMRR